jgi:hypothetical protein
MADLIECAVADDVKEFVIAAAQHVNKTSGTSYHVSDVMSCEDAGEGGKKLKLVMVIQSRENPVKITVPRGLSAHCWCVRMHCNAAAPTVGCYGAAQMRAVR